MKSIESMHATATTDTCIRYCLMACWVYPTNIVFCPDKIHRSTSRKSVGGGGATIPKC